MEKSQEKNKKKGSNVFKEVLPFYLTLKFSGMFPLSFNDSGDLIKKKSDKLMPIIAVILMAISSTVVYVRTFRRTQKMNYVAMGWSIW